jgi:GTP-binding protein
MGNIIGILGRPNVGKSTFFNRLIGMRDAIVDPTSGVTRDRHYGKSDWNGKEFSVIDTGGYVLGSDDVFEEEIRKQAMLAIEESDVILFMVDARDGLTDMDKDVANLLRKSKKKIFLAANKCDSPSKEFEAAEFYQLGLGEVYPVSAQSGTGTGELMDAIVADLPEEDTEDFDGLPRVAFVGRPNVGKSSIINSLIGVDRNIVTSVAGTTRDSVFTRYNSFGFDFMLVDTAGLRRKSKVNEDIEFYSVMRSIRTIEHSDVCVLMIDATEGFEAQDMNIFRLVQKNNKGVVVVVNKWDLIEKETNTHLQYEREIKDKLAPFTDVRVIFTSVLNKQRIFKVMEAIKEVHENLNTKVSTSKLNDTMLPLIENYPPGIGSRGRYIKIKFVTQLPTKIPSFAFFCNLPKDVKDAYARFLENKLRENFALTGVPMRVYFRQK